MVATRGRAGGSLEAEREQIETTLRQAYEDRMSELEEQASASQAFKKQLQRELEQASPSAVRPHARARPLPRSPLARHSLAARSPLARCSLAARSLLACGSLAARQPTDGSSSRAGEHSAA